MSGSHQSRVFTTLILVLDLTLLMLLPWSVGEHCQDGVTDSLAWLGRALPPSCIGHPNGRIPVGLTHAPIIQEYPVIYSGYHTHDLDITPLYYKPSSLPDRSTQSSWVLHVVSISLACFSSILRSHHGSIKPAHIGFPLRLSMGVPRESMYGL
jgi:hypothetical protein